LSTTKYKTGLVIGRFQPFHLGHKFLIEKALEYCKKIVIGIGSPNITDEKNPYSYEVRLEFVKKFIKEENLEDRVLKIVSISDVPDDDEWFKLAQRKTGKIDVEIGDNEWTNGIYESHGIPVLRIGFHKRHILEGTKIRHNIENKKPWKNRVPKYLTADIRQKQLTA
jgi:nicotinamide-nucleotide adenylyltransferase